MKRIFGVGLFAILIALPTFAAKNSQTFLLPTDARVGDAQLPQGHYDVSWTAPANGQVQLTIKLHDKKTVTVAAHMEESKQNNVGVMTSVVNGVTVLEELHTQKLKFVLEPAAGGHAAGGQSSND